VHHGMDQRSRDKTARDRRGSKGEVCPVVLLAKEKKREVPERKIDSLFQLGNTEVIRR